MLPLFFFNENVFYWIDFLRTCSEFKSRDDKITIFFISDRDRICGGCTIIFLQIGLGVLSIVVVLVGTQHKSVLDNYSDMRGWVASSAVTAPKSLVTFSKDTVIIFVNYAKMFYFRLYILSVCIVVSCVYIEIYGTISLMASYSI